MPRESKGYVPPKGPEEEQGGNKAESLKTRLVVLDALFKINPEKAFDEALLELTLQPKKADASNGEKDLLSQYKGMVIEMIGHNYHALPKEKQELFTQLCLELIKPKKE
ncbi:MAG: hypothetical protein Q7S16_01275 [bacterium]|nr:hypothetical protein [bacterium]